MFCKMQNLLLLLYMLIMFSSAAVASNDGNCNIEGIDWTAKNYITTKDDTDISTFKQQYTITGPLDGLSCDPTYDKYVSISVEDGKLTAGLTQDFANIELDVYNGEGPLTKADNIKGSFIVMDITCKMTCEAESSLTIQYRIQDTNNNAPVFTTPSYTFKVPKPLSVQSEITKFGPAIEAYDIDFTSGFNTISFTSKNTDFAIVAKNNLLDVKNTYQATISTTKTLVELESFDITALDVEKSSDASIVLEVDTSNLVDTPSFESSLYKFDYKITDGKPELTHEGDDIKFKTEVPAEQAKLTISGDAQSMIDFTTKDKTVTIKLKDDAVVPSGVAIVTGTLEIETSIKSACAILISLPDIALPKFDEPYYIATYKDQKVEMDPMTISNLEGDPVFTFSEYNDLLTVERNPTTNDFTIVTSGPIVSVNPEVIVKLEATASSSTFSTDISLRVPVVELEFASLKYTAKYDPAKDVLELSPELSVTAPSGATVTISAANPYDVNFEFVIKDGKWVVNIKKKLDELNESELSVDLTATDGTSEAKSVLVLKFNVLPTFSKANYEATYTEAGVVDLDNDISISNKADQSAIQVALTTYNTNFEIKFDGTKWNINILTKLDEEVYKEKKLVIELQAVETDNEKIGYSTLVLNLPEIGSTGAPEFKDDYYSGSYLKDDTLTLDQPIALTSTNIDQIDLTIESDPTNGIDKNFKITKNDADKNWNVEVDKPLDQNILKAGGSIILTLVALDTSNSKSSKTTLVINLPVPEDDSSGAPVFSEVHYTGTYSKENTLTLEKLISLTSTTTSDQIELSIESDPTTGIEKNFKITKNDADKNWNVEVEKPLDQNILNAGGSIILTLVALDSTNSKSSKTTLIINLPVPEIDSSGAPVFSEVHYTGTYSKENTLTLDKLIALTSTNIDQIELSIESDPTNGIDKNFKITKNDADKNWNVEVEKPLDENILKAGGSIILTLVALDSTNSKSSKTTLIINLPVPEIDSSGAPVFSEDHYTGTYSKENTLTLEKLIALTSTNIDQIELSIESDPTTGIDQNFKVTKNVADKNWNVEVEKSLDQNILNAGGSIILTLVALDSTNSKSSKTTLVIDLPVPEVDSSGAPVFSEVHYTGTYSKENTLTLEKLIALTSTNIDQIELSIESDPTTGIDQNFKVTKNVADKNWNVEVEKALDQNILKAGGSIILTLVALDSTNSKSSKTTLIINLPVPEIDSSGAPVFSEVHYTGTYSKENTLTLEKLIALTSTNIDQIELSIESDPTTGFDQNFKVTKNDADKNWNVEVEKSLDQNILNAGGSIILTLVALDSTNSKSSKTTLVIDLPVPEIDSSGAPVFSEVHYTGTYSKENTLTLEKLIALTSTTNFDQIELSIESDPTTGIDTNFKITKNDADKNWNVEVEKALDQNILNAGGSIILTLVALDSTNSKSSKTTLVINLPVPEIDPTGAPVFSEVHYTGTYSKDDTLTLEKVIALTSTTNFDQIELSIESDPTTGFDKNFKVTKNDADKNWNVEVEKALDQNILNAGGSIILTLVALDSTNSKSSKTTLVIDLPIPKIDQTEAPIFTKPSYAGDYKIDSTGQNTVTLEEIIAIEYKSFTIELVVNENDFKNNFELKKETDNSWTVTVTHPLDADILTSGKSLVFTLKATDSTDPTKSTEATLIINLPKPNPTGAPEFTKLHYSGQYTSGTDGNGDVKLDPDQIAVTDDFEDIEVTIDSSSQFKDNFETVRGENVWTINVKAPLDAAVLLSEQSLVVTLSAVNTKNSAASSATLVITLPKSDSIPLLTKIYYVATYSKKDVLTMEDFIYAPGNVNFADVTVTLESEEYSRYFEVIKDPTEYWYVNVKQNLPANILDNQQSLVLPLKAVDLTADVSSASLFVNLPLGESGGSPKSDDYDKTGLIAGISVLAVLLCLSVLGSVGFYYFKIRNKSSYDHMEKDSVPKSPTFTKNPAAGITNITTNEAIDKRRPTGFIFRPNVENEVGETDTDAMDRRKSVAFDENVEEMQIEAVEYDDEVADKVSSNL